MLNSVLKYGIMIFIINTILFSLPEHNLFQKEIFLVLMVVGLFALIIVVQKRLILSKPFFVFGSIILLNFIYFLLFDKFDTDSLNYFLARLVQFVWIIVGIYYGLAYYRSDFIRHITFILIIVALLSILFPASTSGRFQGIIGNPNEFGMLMCSGFGLVLLSNKKLSIIHYAILIVFLILSMMSGSRAIFLALTLAVFIKFVGNIKNLRFLVLYIGVVLLLLFYFGLDLVFERFQAEDQFSDRRLEFTYAYLSFLDKPLEGHGLKNYSYIDQSLVSVSDRSTLQGGAVAPHNGFLSVLVQLGILFGGVFLILVIIVVFRIVRFMIQKKPQDPYFKVYLFFVLYGFLYSMFESIMVGINNFVTIMFWFSIGMLSNEIVHYIKKDPV